MHDAVPCGRGLPRWMGTSSPDTVGSSTTSGVVSLRH
jgi:hypothetical protein